MSRNPCAEIKTVVITGGSRGIGKALVEAFASEGWHVAALARHVSPAFSSDNNPLFVKADVLKPRTLNLAAARLMRGWGRIDLWINNAGGGGPLPFMGGDGTEWAKVFDLNFWGVVHGSRAAVNAMRGVNAGGAIINIASLAGIGACPGHSAYSTAKAAVIALTRSLAVEYARERIRVNAIAPGPVYGRQNSTGTAAARKRARSIPTGKLIAAREIAEACLFLARPLNSLTGHTLVLDGGSAAAGCYAAA